MTAGAATRSKDKPPSMSRGQSTTSDGAEGTAPGNDFESKPISSGKEHDAATLERMASKRCTDIRHAEDARGPDIGEEHANQFKQMRAISATSAGGWKTTDTDGRRNYRVGTT